ncbi:MAG: thioredoxin-disulfide reductase [Candidatus Woesearchaeota archaeon]
METRNVIILGSGCAGLTAAIYNARANLEPLVISGFEPGGQITLTTEVENFPGFPEGIQGPELSENMRKQAEKFGAEFVVGTAKEIIINEDKTITITTDKETYSTKALIIATGARARWLDIESEKKFKGQGVHTCATCDGFFYRGKEIVVVGGGDSACEEANFLTKFAEKVTMLVRRDEMRASKIMQERVEKNPKIDILWNTSIKEIKGDKNVEELILVNTKTNEESTFKTDGIFLGLGHVPNTNFLKDIVELDESGYIIADCNVKTKVPGIFAAGDVADKKYRQAITASGMGCQAAIEAEHYIESLE